MIEAMQWYEENESHVKILPPTVQHYMWRTWLYGDSRSHVEFVGDTLKAALLAAKRAMGDGK
jgi:hypothetical protein